MKHWFFCFGIVLTATACATVENPPAPAGFCEAVQSFVRAPLGQGDRRYVRFESDDDPTGARRFIYKARFGEPSDEAAKLFLDSLSLLSEDGLAVEERISGCLNARSGFERRRSSPEAEEALASAFTYADLMQDARNGRRIIIYADSVGGVSVTVRSRPFLQP